MSDNSESLMVKIKELSKKGPCESITLSLEEYSSLVGELYKVDPWLSDKYVTPGAVPQMYSLFGVKLIVK